MAIIEKIDLVDAIPQPAAHHIARQGPRRIVKLAPVLGGAPVIWRSPEAVEDDDENGKKTLTYQCVILVQKTPKPQTMLVNIPVDLYNKLLDVPVEW